MEAICFQVVRPCVRDSRGSFMFPRYLQYLLTDFRQTFVTGASRDRDEQFRFWGQKVKVQGHTIAAEAHSTRRYRRVQLFLVSASVFRLECLNGLSVSLPLNLGKILAYPSDIASII